MDWWDVIDDLLSNLGIKHKMEIIIAFGIEVHEIETREWTFL